MLSASTPPSTDKQQLGPADRPQTAQLLQRHGSNSWPPKPGMTLITSTRSQTSRKSLKAAIGVGGLSEIPANAPSCADLPQQRPRIGHRLDVDRHQVRARLRNAAT